MKKSLTAAVAASEIMLILCVAVLFSAYLFGEYFGAFFEPVFLTSSFGVCVCAILDATFTFLADEE